jgi:pantoate--beta-alanine ligase
VRAISTIDELRRERRRLESPVGFVPTMGYLHEGHLSLVRLARKANASVVVSIFVNPTQFGPKEDLATYPRDVPRDLALLEQEGTYIAFVPTAEEMYPEGFSTWVEVGTVTERLEGAYRPGHFRGVATVVAKLFNLVEPDRAYFGQKDAQQVLVIRKMVADLNMNVEVVVCPTVREPDGLAMSSRNSYLGPDEREAAPVLYRSLMLARRLWQEGERDARCIRREMARLLQREPLAGVDYVSVAHPETLAELDIIEERALVSLAVRIGKTRLIDNIILEPFPVRFTRQEIGRYNGRDGAPAFVAYEGKVYDVTSSFLWRDGKHREHVAGADLTQELKTAPHGPEWLQKFPVIGTLE